VVATDYYAWHGVGWGTGEGKAAFQLAREVLGSRVEDVDVDVMDLSPERVGSFNVVLFLVARRVQNRATSATRNADKPVIVSPAVAQPSTAAYAAASDTQIRRLAS